MDERNHGLKETRVNVVIEIIAMPKSKLLKMAENVQIRTRVVIVKRQLYERHTIRKGGVKYLPGKMDHTIHYNCALYLEERKCFQYFRLLL